MKKVESRGFTRDSGSSLLLFGSQNLKQEKSEDELMAYIISHKSHNQDYLLKTDGFR